MAKKAMDAMNREVAKKLLDHYASKEIPLKWQQAEHVAALAHITLKLVEAELGEIEPKGRKALKDALTAQYLKDGLGGNASQFGTSLVGEGLLPPRTATQAGGVEIPD